jgi:hypothetical protein
MHVNHLQERQFDRGKKQLEVSFLGLHRFSIALIHLLFGILFISTSIGFLWIQYGMWYGP